MYSWVYGVDEFMENLLEMNIKMSYSVKTYWKVKSELEKYGCGSVWSWTRSDIRKNRQELLDPCPTLEKKPKSGSDIVKFTLNFFMTNEYWKKRGLDSVQTGSGILHKVLKKYLNTSELPTSKIISKDDSSVVFN